MDEIFIYLQNNEKFELQNTHLQLFDFTKRCDV
jgi:hypothetical protein